MRAKQLVAPPVTIAVERRRFFDGGLPDGDPGGPAPPDPSADVCIVLDRQLDHGHETFRLRRRIGYDDRHCGRIIVPPAFDAFDTDLTSVPGFFTWLVPKTGEHLPAALIHDGLIGPEDAPTYISESGKVIDRVEADRIFRDGMADTGTGLVRRWLIWTAVTLATIWEAKATSAKAWARQYYRAVMAITLAVVAVAGYFATADLFDRGDSWWLASPVPWIPDGSFLSELVYGIAGAVVLGAVLGLLWGKFAPAGVITGVALALLLHVTAAVVLASLAYQALEWCARNARLFLGVMLVIVVAATALFVMALAS